METARDGARTTPVFSGSMSAAAAFVNGCRDDSMPRWALFIPLLAAAFLAVAIVVPPGPVLVTLCSAALVATVIAAVHHAEVVAHRVGEPFGTLVLAVAVTIIEVALILSIMLAGGLDAAALPRDTIYAAIMIICNGVVGLCILVGGLVHHEQSFRVEGSSAGLAALIALSTSRSSCRLSPRPLPAARTALRSLLSRPSRRRRSGRFTCSLRPCDIATTSFRLWTRRAPDAHAVPPTNREAWTSFALLVVSLVSVVGLAKLLSPLIEQVVEQAGAPKAVIGIVIALLVLLPETWAAVRAAYANRLQTSMNLALGSALASIGLTIPVVAASAICPRHTAGSGPRAEGPGDARADPSVEHRHAGNAGALT